MVKSEGKLVDRKKNTCAQALILTGLAQYFDNTGNKGALDSAIRLFREFEVYARDRENNGYREFYIPGNSPKRDESSNGPSKTESDRDHFPKACGNLEAANIRSAETHLHVLEAYTALYRVWKSPELEQRLRSLIFIFTNKILDPATWHLGLFFNEVWDPTDSGVSCGLDFAAAKLIMEAARALGDESVSKGLQNLVSRLAETAFKDCANGL